MNRIATHEAGHVTVATFLGHTVSTVSIISTERSEGDVFTPDIDSWPLEHITLFLVGGIVAEELMFGDTEDWHYYRSDRNESEKVFHMRRRAHHQIDSSFPRYIMNLKKECNAILTEPYGYCLLLRITKMLDERKHLDKHDIEDIAASCRPIPSEKTER